jgi:hypothetical protein
LSRELDRIALVKTQLAAVERARDALIRTDAEQPNNPAGSSGIVGMIGPKKELLAKS